MVSPLKSLITDQVQKLNALEIKAAHLLADDPSNKDGFVNSESVYRDLQTANPQLKLVYVTPEKLNNSGKLAKIMVAMYQRNKVARLVIDEAHCVSAWGHDFRKDYTQLGDLRKRLFPNLQVMLLTATATPRVRKDILVQMGLSSKENGMFGRKVDNKQCAFFMQSFNRENLQYKVGI